MLHTMKNNAVITLTGDRPTGRLHLGHYVGSLTERIKLQATAEQAFYMIADVQALTDNADNPDKVRNNVLEVALDNLAVGVDPTKTTMYIQSLVPEIAELTIFFLNLVTVNRLLQNPTVKTEILQKGWGLSEIKETNGILEKTENINKPGVPAGFLTYPISQAADILIMKSNIIPVGEDQKPIIELTNEIIDTFNRYYGEVFSKVKIQLSETPRLVGTDGNAKMSKSLGNCIYLADSNEIIEEKVMAMYTDPNHIRVEDPGNIEGNVVFTYLDIFDPNKPEVLELKAQYQKGGLGDVVLKKRLVGILQELITPIREKRERLAQDPRMIMDILKDGTATARKTAQATLAEVRQAMKIDYF